MVVEAVRGIGQGGSSSNASVISSSAGKVRVSVSVTTVTPMTSNTVTTSVGPATVVTSSSGFGSTAAITSDTVATSVGPTTVATSTSSGGFGGTPATSMTSSTVATSVGPTTVATSTSSGGFGGGFATSSAVFASSGFFGTSSVHATSIGNAAETVGGGSRCDGNSCFQACGSANLTAASSFVNYELQRCGCFQPEPPCGGVCQVECTEGTPIQPCTPCGFCLAEQEGFARQSACTGAAMNDCQADPTCAPFLECALGCGSGG